MGTDGPIFVQKGGYFLLIQVTVCLTKLAFSYFLSQFYEGFLTTVFSQFCSNIIRKVAFN